MQRTIPVDRSIRWTPRLDRYYLLGHMLGAQNSDYVVFVTQPLLIRLRQEMQQTEEPLLGLLTGRVCECPDTSILYTVITGASAAQVERGKEREDERLTRELAAARERDIAVLGWYRSRPHLEVDLSPADSYLARTLLTSPWQCGLVLATDGDGAFFQYKGLARRSYAIPFHELLAAQTFRTDGPRHTCVDWPGYETTDPIAPMTEQEYRSRSSAAEDPVYEVSSFTERFFGRIERRLRGR